jgi:hypothetical protein
MGADLKESTSVARRMKSGPAFVHQKKEWAAASGAAHSIVDR